MSTELPFEIEEPVLLLVEGSDDKVFFKIFIEHIGLCSEHKIQIHPVNGKDNFRPALKMLKLATNFSTVKFIGIVRDSDMTPEATLQSVQDGLRDAGFDIPDQAGTITTGSPQISVLLLPDEKMEGEFEDILLKSVEDLGEMDCVNSLFDCLKDRGISSPKKLSKAKVQAFLATKEDPDYRPGIAVQKGYFPLDHSAFETIKCFLENIMNSLNS